VTEQQKIQDKQWGLIVARAWADGQFKSRLMTDPKTVFREHGLEVEPDVSVSVVEDTDRVRHFVLPPNPEGELTEEELSPAAGYDSFSGICGRCGGCGCGGCRMCRGCRGCDAT